MKTRMNRSIVQLTLVFTSSVIAGTLIYAGCGVGQVDENCKPPEGTQNCYHHSNYKSCPFIAYDDHQVEDKICNTKWKTFAPKKQESCQARLMGVECNVYNAPCGTSTTGSCVNGQPNCCTAEVNYGVVSKGEAVYYNVSCNAVDGSEPADVPGGWKNVQESSPNCTPFPTPEPGA